MKIVHVIVGLDTGGAEMMLYRLMCRTDRNEFDATVVSLTDVGPTGEEIRQLNVPVIALGIKRGRLDPWMVLKLAGRLRQDRPDLIQTWMYHADLVGALAAKIAGRIPIVWGVHHSNLSYRHNKKTTLLTAQMCARLSGYLPSKIVCCSQASERIHAQLGYDRSKMVVIPNGFDLDTFTPNTNAPKAIRKQLGLAQETFLVGLVARLDPQKDHENFFRAAGLFHRDHPGVHFLLCGDGINWNNASLTAYVDEAGVRSVTHLLGRRSDMASIQAALDIASLSSSYGEAFPNVVGEAMSCGVPCVVTDVGDSAWIVGDTARVVPPRDPIALANAWRELIEMGRDARHELGLRARKRVAENFSLNSVVQQYENLYKEIIKSAKT